MTRRRQLSLGGYGTNSTYAVHTKYVPPVPFTAHEQVKTLGEIPWDCPCTWVWVKNHFEHKYADGKCRHHHHLARGIQ